MDMVKHYVTKMAAIKEGETKITLTHDGRTDWWCEISAAANGALSEVINQREERGRAMPCHSTSASQPASHSHSLWQCRVEVAAAAAGP